MAGSSGTEEMLASIETLTRNVKNLKSQLRNHTQEIEWTDTRFSWPASMGLQVPIYDQSAGNSWTYAFATGHQYHNAIRGLGKRKLRPETLQKHVKKKYQSHEGGLRYFGHVKEYLVQHDYVQDVKVFDKDEGANLEKYMEELLFVSPVVVKIPMLRSWRDYEGIGIYKPSRSEIESLSIEEMTTHIVVITGMGAKLRNGALTEFWEFQNSWGESWGEHGFGRFVRGRGFILTAYDLQF